MQDLCFIIWPTMARIRGAQTPLIIYTTNSFQVMIEQISCLSGQYKVFLPENQKWKRTQLKHTKSCSLRILSKMFSHISPAHIWSLPSVKYSTLLSLKPSLTSFFTFTFHFLFFSILSLLFQFLFDFQHSDQGQKYRWSFWCRI